MTDSTFVLPPGERVTDDATGAPISGATLYFYDAGTTNPKTVYADADLSASLGTSVVTDSLGYPTSDGTSRTLIYVGTAPYKIVAKDADGNTLFTHDNIPGAVVSASSVDVSVTATFPVVTKSLAYAIVAADQNTTFLVNCSSASVSLTLPSATDNNIPNGWKIKVQHAGSANQAIVVVKPGSGQNIYEGTKTLGGGSFALALNGEDCEITADGGNWRITSHTPPFIKKGQGIIPVVSRLGTSPGTPNAGDIYILTGVGGSWSTFTTGDLALYTGAGWTNYTPPANCGWRAWVQGESLYYSYIGSAWAVETGTASQSGTFKAATQTAQEAASANDTAVTPGTQKSHPAHPKLWGKATVSGGVPALTVSYGMTSVTDSALGIIAVNFATAFSSGDFAGLYMVQKAGTNLAMSLTSPNANGMTLNAVDTGGTSRDPDAWHWTAIGDQ